VKSPASASAVPDMHGEPSSVGLRCPKPVFVFTRTVNVIRDLQMSGVHRLIDSFSKLQSRLKYGGKPLRQVEPNRSRASRLLSLIPALLSGHRPAMTLLLTGLRFFSHQFLKQSAFSDVTNCHSEAGEVSVIFGFYYM